MHPFAQLCEIEQFTETPRNRVWGPFCCLLEDMMGTIIWRMYHAPDSGRHPYATARVVARRTAK